MNIHTARLHKTEKPRERRLDYFFCKFCNTDIKITSDIRSITSHANNEHLEVISKIWSLCEICGKYLSAGRMSSHMKLQHLKMRNCNFCPKKFLSSILPTHANTRHLEEVSKIWLKCDQCNFYLATSEDLQKHLKMTHVKKSTGRLQFKCSHCRESFPTKISLSRHLKTHEVSISPTINEQLFRMKV